MLLTKTQTMAVGLLWFVFRRDYRSLAIALGTTLVIAAVSFAINPGAWADYLDARQHEPDARLALPMADQIRVPFVLALVIWGSVTCRPWAVALGSCSPRRGSISSVRSCCSACCPSCPGPR